MAARSHRYRRVARSPHVSILTILLIALVGVLMGTVPVVAQVSFSNKVLTLDEIQTPEDGTVLLVSVATGIYENPSFAAQCADDEKVAIRLDATSPEHATELELIRQILETARVGPYRVGFFIIGGCVRLAEGDEKPSARAPGVPVARGVFMQQKRPSE